MKKTPRKIRRIIVLLDWLKTDMGFLDD